MDRPSDQIEEFDAEKSPLREAYLLLHAFTPLQLSNLYTAEDQKLMLSKEWDYNNPELITNKIKTTIESVDLSLLPERERVWAQEILWFWYHHAISCAIWRYKDKIAARAFAAKALEYQTSDHPNKITQLLFLLVHDRVDEAEEWAEGIEKEPERSSAISLVNEWKTNSFA